MMDEEKDKGPQLFTQAAFQLGALLNQEPIKTPDGGQAVIVPEGYELKELGNFQEHPAAVKISHTFDNLESFANYVKRYKEPGAVIFGDSRGFHAVIDCYLPDNLNWCQHTVRMPAQFTEEWVTWLGHPDGESMAMSQRQLAYMVDDWLHLIAKPDAGKFMDAVKSFQSSTKINFKSVKNLQNGTIQLQYEETEDQLSEAKLPDAFTLMIRPFLFSGAVEVTVKLRYKVRDGGITFTLHRPPLTEIVNKSITDTLATLKKSTGCDVYQGKWNAVMATRPELLNS